MSRKRHLNKHHRKPTSIGGTNEERNISEVGKTQHEAWHKLFHNHTAAIICHIINSQWLDPDYKFVCVPTEDEAEAMEFAKELRRKRGK